jgi:hypothetical protein
MVNLREALEAVRSLNLPKNQFAITGSTVMMMHGIVPLVRDIDIIAYGDAWKNIKGGGLTRRARLGDDMISLRDGLIEIYNGWTHMGWRVQDIIDESYIIDGIRCVKLERILEWKSGQRRLQDVVDINLIEEYLENQKRILDEKEIRPEPLKKAQGG